MWLDPQWLWTIAMLLGLLGSFLFSGMETGSYRINRVRLSVRSGRGDPAGKRLQQMMDRPVRLLATLLIANNLSNALTTTAFGVLLEQMSWPEWMRVVVNTLVMTLVMTLFSEALPKDLFSKHADRFMYPLSRVLSVLQRVLSWCGAVQLVAGFSRLVIALVGKPVSSQLTLGRQRLGAMVEESAGYGVISDHQSELASRVLALGHRPVTEVMTPWSRVCTLDADSKQVALLATATNTPYSRYPLVDAQGQVVGIIDFTAVLAQGLNGQGSLRDIAVDSVVLPSHTSLRHALDSIKRHPVGFGIVVNRNGDPIGFVTVRDLLRPIVGQIAGM